MGVLAKTDRVDAGILRDFADVLARHKDRAKFITPMLAPERQLLVELMGRRRQLVDMRVAEGKRLEHAAPLSQGWFRIRLLAVSPLSSGCWVWVVEFDLSAQA